MTQAINIGAFVSHLAGDLSNLTRELKTYGMGFSDPPTMQMSPEEWQQDIRTSLERVAKAQQLLNMCAVFLMKPNLLAKAEAEV